MPTKPSLSIEYLAYRPQFASVLARWFAQEWGDGTPRRSTGLFEERLPACTSRRRLPICLIRLVDGDPVATSTLKFRETAYSMEADYWLADVFVRQDLRGFGHGRIIVEAAETQSKALKLTPLYLYTPSQESFYRHLGWHTLGTTVVGDRRVTVIRKQVLTLS